MSSDPHVPISSDNAEAQSAHKTERQAARFSGKERRRAFGPGGITTGVAVVLVVAGLATFFGAAVLFLDAIQEAPENLIIFFGAAILLTVGLLAFVGSRILDVYRDWQAGRAGSKMHARLIALLSIMSILPAIVAFVFTATVLQSFSREFFVERVQVANDLGLALGNGYVTREANVSGGELVRLAIDLQRLEDRESGLYANPIGFRNTLGFQANLRGFTALYVLDGERRLITRVRTAPGVDYALPEKYAFDAVDAGTDERTRSFFRPLDAKELNVFYSMLKIDAYGGGYLIGYKAEDPQIFTQLQRLSEVRAADATFAARLASLKQFFTIGFILIATIILLCAIYAGMLTATTIVSPIRRLGAAAQKIAGGDLSARVDIRNRDGELGDFARTFNEMTGDLEGQRTSLLEANQQLDQRRVFTEAVLSGVSAGVLGTDREGRITIANSTAADFLGLAQGRLIGMPLRDAVPAFQELAEEALKSKDHAANGQVEHEAQGTTRLFSVRISGSETDDGATSYVVTFDDITELLAAQRNAAWGDVARRIAHEIKNPLTPIQLSAERLRRKYLSEIKTNPEVFERCTDTIIRHVGDIGRMVSEFSSFARMPEPVMAREQLREIVKAAVFPFQVSSPHIEFDLKIPDEPITVFCDGRLVVQACTNLIKNAVEAIEEKDQKAIALSGGRIRIEIKSDDTFGHILVRDNGKGLPEKSKHRLTEPYMTTREKGTGLGLAIVRKVIEEHGGRLALKNDTALGPTGAIASIILPLAGEDEQAEGATSLTAQNENTPSSLSQDKSANREIV